MRIGEIDVVGSATVSSGVAELDRVLGGGFVPGAVILLAGEPGVGKSTLLLEVAARSADTGAVLVVSGEESATQVRLRAERTGAIHRDLWLASENDLGAVLTHIDQVKPSLLILDSVQTVSSSAVEGTAGGVSQVREVASVLTRVAKERGITTILVGHVTKEGSLAGPRTLEHLVDVVLHFEGERHSSLRMVRAIKNRYGPADEIGCFEMQEDGIKGVSDPSGLFLTRRDKPIPGTCLTVAVEGRRPFVAEIQALIGNPNGGDNPDKVSRRGVHGLDQSRVQMLLAVLSKNEVRKSTEKEDGSKTYAPSNYSGRDIYTATVGGMKVLEPAGDLAICLALSSAANGKNHASNIIAIGEVGLTGDIRTVPSLQRRLNEASRMGFTEAIVPRDQVTAPAGMRVTKVETLSEAMRLIGP